MTSTLTPPGELLTEEGALTLWNNRARLRPDQLPRAKEKLRAYRDARQTAGEPVWPSAALAERRYQEQVESLFLDGAPVPGASNQDDADMIRDYSFLSLVTKQPGHVIAQTPSRLRKGVADYLGDPNAGDSPAAMKALATQYLKQQRDIRYLIEGNGKNDEASRPLNESSLFASAWNAARDGKAAADGYFEWAAQSSSRPEWKSAQSDDLFAKYSAAHGKAAAKWADYRARVGGISSALGAATGDEKPLLDASAALPFVSGLTREERQTVLSLLKEKAGTAEKGAVGKSGEAVGRVFARLMEGDVDNVLRTATALTFSEGQEVPAGMEGDPAGLVDESMQKALSARADAANGLPGAAQFGQMFAPSVPVAKLTKEQADAANAENERRKEAISLKAELRDIGRGTIDPVKGSNWWSDKLYYGSLNLAASIASFASPAGMALNWNAYVTEEQNRLEAQGVDPQTAAMQAVGVGSAQAALDQLSLHLLSRLPVLRSIKGALTAPAAGIAGTAARRIPGALGIAAGEALIEGTQDALPLLTQKTLAALKVDEPDVPWDQIGKEAWASTETTFFAMLPLALIGLGMGTSRDYKNVRAIVTDRNALQQLGFSKESTDYIVSGENAEQSVQRLRESWGGRTPQVTVAASPAAQEADAVLQDPNASAPEVISAAQSKARYEEELARGSVEVQELQRYAGVSEVRRTDAGWEIVRDDGTVIPTSSPDAAVAILHGLGQAADQTEAEALVAIADAWHGQPEATAAAGEETSTPTPEASVPGETTATVQPAEKTERRTTTFTGTIARGTRESITYSRPGSAEVVREVTDRATLANLYEEARLVGAEDINVVVNGSNRVFAERVADGAERIVKVLEINLGGQPQVITLLHEQVEANLKTGLQSGTVTDSEMMSALNFAAMALPANGAPASDAAGRAFRERIMRGAMGGLSSGEMRETVVELAVADTIGKRKDGGFMPAGAISRALTAALHGDISPEERSGIQKFRALLRAVKSYIRGVMGTVAGLRKARRDGKLAEGNSLDTLLEKITGRSQQETHNREVLAENGETRGPDETGTGTDAPTFSLSSVDSLEAVAAQIEARMARGGPETRVEVLGNLARTLSGMARSARHNEEVERVLAAGQIESKRRALRKELLDQYTIDVLESPVGAALGADLSLRDSVVIGQVIDPARKGLHGMLLAPSKARRQGRMLAGEYDDAAGVPGWMFHGERTPDQVATSLGMDVAEMWSAIHDELSAHAKMRDYEKSARQQMGDARVRASRETAAWASKERAKLAQSDVRDARRALIALDAMILQLPAEVRKTVGGFAPLSELTTNKAREAYFLKAVDRIDRALETHLRKDFKTRIAGLFDRARARMNPGNGDRGKLGVNGHAWFQRAEQISKLGEQALAERGAFIESRLNGTQDLTDAEITELNRLWDFGGGQEGARIALEQEQALLDLFGGMNHTDASGRPVKSSGELEAAWKAARETLAQNRSAWEARITGIRTWRIARKLQLQADSRNTGTPDVIKARKKALEGLGGDIQDFMQKGFTFEQLVGDIFGRESATHQYAERTALSAQIQEKRDWMNRQGDFAEFARSLWPRTKQIGIQKNLEELQLPRKVPGAPSGLPEMSQMEAVHYTMLWADLDSRDWLAEWKLGDDAQAAMEAWLTPEAKEIRRWLQERYDSQHDEINEVYRRLYGVNMARVLAYTPRIVEHGTTTTVSDPQNPGQAETRGVFAGFTKRRRPVITSQPIQMDALSAYWQNQRVTGHWRAWAEPMRELRALFSTNDTQPYIKAASGEDAAVYVNQWLTDLENNGYREGLAIRGLQKFLGVNARNALFGKLGVLGKQTPAAYGAALEIGWGEYQKSVRRIAAGEAAITPEEMWNSEIMRQRRWTDDPVASQAGRASGMNRFDRMLRRVGVEPYAIDMANEWLGGRIGWTDAFFTQLGAAAAYDFHYRQAIERGESDAEARVEAMGRTEITIARTAQPDSLVTKSLYENRMGLWGRVMFAFQSANRQALFATFAAFRDGGMKSGRAWRMALTHWALTGFLTQTIGNIARMAFSDDDADEIWEVGDYVRAMILGPLTGALYLGQAVDLIGGLTGGFERRAAPGIFGAIGDGGRKAIDLLTDPEAEFNLKSADVMIRALGYAIGGRAAAGNVSMNIWKQIDGLRRNVGLRTEKEATAKESKTRNKRDKAEKQAEEEVRRAALTPEEQQAEDDQKEEEEKRRKAEKLDKQREKQGPL